jgi:hypothetical protein
VSTGVMVLLILSALALIVVSLLPIVIARRRRHPQALAITAMNMVSVMLLMGAIVVLFVDNMASIYGRSLSESALILLVAYIPWIIALLWSCWAFSPQPPSR